jgi:hypothetical protein
LDGLKLQAQEPDLFSYRQQHKFDTANFGILNKKFAQCVQEYVVLMSGGWAEACLPLPATNQGSEFRQVFHRQQKPEVFFKWHQAFAISEQF